MTLTMNDWNSWLSTGLDQIMILLRDISFDLLFVSHMYVFRNHFFINLIAHTLRARGCQFDIFVVAGGTASCHYDNFRCHQWWRGCRADDLLFSEYDIALYILALFICRILAFWLMLFVVHTTLNKFYLILSKCHNERVLNHRRLDCLLNRLFRHRSKKTSNPRIMGLCAGN